MADDLAAAQGLRADTEAACPAGFAHPAILAGINASNSRANAARSGGPVDPPKFNVLDLVLRLIEEHIAITAEERMAVALWLLHT